MLNADCVAGSDSAVKLLMEATAKIIKARARAAGAEASGAGTAAEVGTG